MRYYKKVLQSDETVRYFGRLHWLIYVGSWLFGFLGIICVFLAMAAGPNSSDQPPIRIICAIAALIFLAIALVRAFWSFLRQWSTEIVVTDRRVLFKTGLISRHTLEMNITKIETVDVDQPLIGRLLGYGTISVHGTGASMEPMRRVAQPLKLRNSILVG